MKQNEMKEAKRQDDLCVGIERPKCRLPIPLGSARPDEPKPTCKEHKDGDK